MTGNKFAKCLIRSLIAIVTLSWAACSSEAQTSASSASYKKGVAQNLEKIAKAMNQHHDTWKSFPAAGIEYPTPKARGTQKYYLSWRVRLLPFLGEQELFDKFNLEEPWDSPRNKALIPEMPGVYRTPSQSANEYKTVFVGAVYPEDMPRTGFYGQSDKPQELQRYLKGTVFDDLQRRGSSRKFAWGATGDPHSITLKMQESILADTKDGLINTVMVFEAAPEEAVVWTQSADWVFDVEHPRRGLPPGGFQAAFLDDSIHFIPLAKVDDEFLRRLFCVDDGGRLEWNEK
jgi:hypothetical protein